MLSILGIVCSITAGIVAGEFLAGFAHAEEVGKRLASRLSRWQEQR